MKAVVTVLGKDKVGIIAGVTSKLAELNVNVLDLSQTIMQDYFTMIMFVEFDEKSANAASIQDSLLVTGESIGVEIKVQQEAIFNAMHRI